MAQPASIPSSHPRNGPLHRAGAASDRAAMVDSAISIGKKPRSSRQNQFRLLFSHHAEKEATHCVLLRRCSPFSTGDVPIFFPLSPSRRLNCFSYR